MKQFIFIIAILCFSLISVYAQQITKRQQYIVVNTLNQYCDALEKYAGGNVASRFIIEDLFETSENSVWNDIDNMTLVPLSEYLNLIQLSKNSFSLSFIDEPNIDEFNYFMKEDERFGENKKMLYLVCKLTKSINNSTSSLYYIVNAGNYKVVNCYKEMPPNIQLSSINKIKTDNNIVSRITSNYSDLTDASTQNSIGDDLYDATQYTEAVIWYHKSAKQGNDEAQYNLGRMYYNGYGVEKDGREAIKWWDKSAWQGNAESQNELGDMYYYGFGVERSHLRAVSWYRKAAEQGNVDGQYSMGRMYYLGYGVYENYKDAIKWYRKAAEQGSIIAQTSLGDIYYYGDDFDSDFQEAEKWYRKAAEQGDIDSQIMLGVMFYEGFGVQDYKVAIKWYKKAAEQGDALAQFLYGKMYYQGLGVEKDYYKAVKWYRKSAEQEYAVAQYNLGSMYQFGDGIEKNIVKAKYWYSKACENGDTEACEQYDLIK